MVSFTMISQSATFINLNSSPLLKASEATTFTFKNIDGELHFHKIENVLFRNNLILVDGLLPEILGEVLIYAYTNNCFEVSTAVEAIEKINPLKYSTKYDMKFYTYKIKELLRNLSSGMKATEVWNGPGSIYDHFPVFNHKDALIYYTDTRFLNVLYKKAKLKIIDMPEMDKTFPQDEPFTRLNLQIEID
jgi:hypothetical protein